MLFTPYSISSLGFMLVAWALLFPGLSSGNVRDVLEEELAGFVRIAVWWTGWFGSGANQAVDLFVG